MGVVLGGFFFARDSGVVGDGPFGVHDFPLLFDEEEDGLCGAHFGRAFEVLLEAEDLGIVGKLDLQLTLVDFYVNAN